MILTAIPVGFFAGLFGIGGGLISVPFLYYLFSSFGVEQTYVMHLAVGTSFSIIIPTAIVSVMTHHKFKAVDFSIVKSYGGFVITGVICGTIFASSLNTKPLVLFFSIVVFILAFYLLYLKITCFAELSICDVLVLLDLLQLLVKAGLLLPHPGLGHLSVCCLE